MKKNISKKSIVFINPFFCKLNMGTAGIAYIRGYLNKEKIDSKFINVNDLILQNDEYLRQMTTYCIKLNKKLGLNIKKGDDLEDYCKKSLSSIEIGDSKKNILWKLISEEEKELLFLNKIYAQVKREKIIGFSITCFSQFLFTILSVYYIKKHINKEIKVVIGGSWVFSYLYGIFNFLKINPIVDYIVSGEGEIAVRDLLLSKEESSIPNLYYLKNKNYVSSKISYDHMQADEYPTPFYENDEVLPTVRCSNGVCYWNKCSFCVKYHRTDAQKYNLRSPKNIVDDIVKIKKQLKNIKCFYFSDSAISKSHFIGIINEMSNRKIFNNYFLTPMRIFMRLEPWLTEYVFKKARKFGFGVGDGRYAFGLETSVPRLEKLINKGLGIEVANKIFDICIKNNISIQINLIVGLPTQTKDDLLADLNYTLEIIKKYKNLDNIIIKCNLFYLFGDTHMSYNQDKYEIMVTSKSEKILPRILSFIHLGKNTIKDLDEVKMIIFSFLNKIDKKYSDRYIVNW